MAFRWTPAVLLFWVPPALLAQTPARRDSLRLADQELSLAVFRGGLAAGLTPALRPDAVLLLEGAPIVRGKEAIARLLEAQTSLGAVRLSWQPFRVVVSEDGLLGVSFGGTVLQRGVGGGLPGIGRYMAVWQRGAGGRWELVAHLENGLFGPNELVLPAGLGTFTAETGGDAFTAADLAFARLAGERGAPTAFAQFVAPDGMTLAPTGELNLGPAAVGARVAEGRAGTAAWEWHPVISFAASSGDLGVTIGEAAIQLKGGEPATTFYSKYLSIWQRQPDGSLKFILDGGSSRPAPLPPPRPGGAPPPAGRSR